MASLPELGFSDLPAFNVWWRAVLANDWDIRRFPMPMGSDNRAVQKALRNVGIRPARLSEQAMTLTLSEAQALDDPARFYLAGRTVSEPQHYALPAVDWVLADNIAIYQSIAQHHPESVQHAQLVPLNEAVRTWAQAHDKVTEPGVQPDWVGLDDSIEVSDLKEAGKLNAFAEPAEFATSGACTDVV